jgi:hypothetical protein
MDASPSRHGYASRTSSLPATDRSLPAHQRLALQRRRGQATEVVRTLNALREEFVCFAGDQIEEACFAPAALEFVRQINYPG